MTTATASVAGARASRVSPALVRYLGLRLAQAVVALWGVVTAVFFCLRLSGDPAQLLAPQGATREQVDELRTTLGLDASTWSQYTSYLADLLRGDLGYSFVQRRPAIDVITQRLPYTINLALAALALSILFGVGAGMVMALYRGRWPERVLTPVVLAGQAMPAFWTGILLILVFSVTFNVFPSTGDTSASSIVLPAVTLASLSAATVARVTRAAVLEQLNRDYVRTALSKGVGTWRLVWRHLLRNIAVPVLTVLALETANLLGGSVVTELIYAWPGLGQLTVQSVNARDFPVVQALVVLAAVVYTVINLVTDLVYGVIDPRIAVTAKGTDA